MLSTKYRVRLTDICCRIISEDTVTIEERMLYRLRAPASPGPAFDEIVFIVTVLIRPLRPAPGARESWKAGDLIYDLRKA